MAEGSISPWWPEQDQLRLAVLGKLVEECNELGARAARCIIHGLDEVDPDTGRTNREELERESADVDACILVARETLDLDAMPTRALGKRQGFRRWHGLIAGASK